MDSQIRFHKWMEACRTAAAKKIPGLAFVLSSWNEGVFDCTDRSSFRCRRVIQRPCRQNVRQEQVGTIMKKLLGIALILAFLMLSERSHAIAIHDSTIVGMGCTAAVKTTYSGAAFGPIYYVILLYAEHWHEIQGNALAGLHTLSDYAEETNFLSISDTFGSLGGVIKIKVRGEHDADRCLANGGMIEMHRVTWEEKEC